VHAAAISVRLFLSFSLSYSLQFLGVSTRSVRDFLEFSVCPSNKQYPSAPCAYAANLVGKDLDIFAIEAVFIDLILLSYT
jgi:hypothetical protein